MYDATDTKLFIIIIIIIIIIIAITWDVHYVLTEN
jgi:hypothetical protein